VKSRVPMRLCVVACSALVLGAVYGSQRESADSSPPIDSPGAGNDSIRAFLKDVWPALSSAGKPGRVYYHANCSPNDHSSPLSPLEFPKIDVQPPLSTGSDLAVVRSIFRRDHTVTVAEDETGIVRIRIGEVPDAILRTRISTLSLDARRQFNVLSAIAAIESAPEVQSVMRTLKIRLPVTAQNFRVILPDESRPHLPTEISNVAMDQALDMVARTWGGIVFYGACARPATYQIFFADSVYFLGAKL